MSRQEEMFQAREERLKNEILELVEERDRMAVAEIEKQNQYLVEQIKSMKSEIREAQQTISQEAKALALSDFDALRSEISELEDELKHFDASDEARSVINGYREELERINNIGEEKLARIVAHAHSAQEDMHQKLDIIDGVPTQVNSQLSATHDHIISRINENLVKTLDKIYEYTKGFEKRANKSDRTIEDAAKRVKSNLSYMQHTVDRVNNMGGQVLRTVFGWWFLTTMFTAFFLGVFGWVTASYFFG